MLGSTIERPISDDERTQLEKMERELSTTFRRWLRCIENTVVLAAVLLLGLILGWSAIAWVLQKAFQVGLDWSNPNTFWILVLGVTGCATVAFISSIRRMKSAPDVRPLLLADLASGKVIEEHLVLTAAKRFQEPEHGGLIHFLRTSDDRVLVIFDQASMEAGALGEDPLADAFQPRANVVFIRAPQSHWVIESRHFGEFLAVGEPLPLTGDMSELPESEEFCDIPWDDLEGRLSRPN